MTERERLIKDLHLMFDPIGLCCSDIADYIIADRARIVQPIAKLDKSLYKLGKFTLDTGKAIEETLKNAGITNVLTILILKRP